MQICIFEDENYSDFYPLTYSRPVYDLVCGINTLREKISGTFPDHRLSLHCRKYLEEIVRTQNPGSDINKITESSCLFINGRILASSNLEKIFTQKEAGDRIFKNGNTIVAVKLSDENLKQIGDKLNDTLSFETLSKLPTVNVNVEVINYVWELINENGNEIVKDIEYIKRGKANLSDLKKYNAVSFLNEDEIFIDENVTIKPGVVIDATNGPVFIDKDAFIYPNAVIEGPVYIGKKSKIKSGAVIYENVSIGSVCKIGGEVEDAIILPYTNKQHAGFIGHSYLGGWVNLGADTNCSDLKNNYSTIKVQLNGKTIDTGSQFLGVIIGDHSKSAINTMFNTGTIVGFSSNIFGAGFPEKYIPSFAWGGAEGISTYELDKSIKTAKIVMNRRNKDFLPADEKLFDNIFKLTSNERND